MTSALRIVTAAELDAWGYSSRKRRAEPTSSLLVPLRAGLFAIRDEWEGSTPEAQITARAAALARVAVEPPVFSHHTAAALLGLPLYDPDPSKLHVIVPDERPGRARGVIRHRGVLDVDEVIAAAGLHCTSPRRTVADVARTATPEAAVAVADAALRSLFVRDRRDYDEQGALAWADSAVQTARRSAHGVARATRVLAFADGRAERPGESVSRLRLAQLGYRRPRLQLRVPAPHAGKNFFVDFGLDDAGALGEFDGRIKYVGGRLQIDRTEDEVFEAEKEREDWIRGVTGRPLVRWGWSHIATPATLGARLRAFGVTAPD
ncbi:hypothetical protein ACFUTX_13060 [Microbacterium sp. NPDC057407]|uniref:hypothetical protein n=1 Tax=Microbacterium sp. NPDC057407 TaxID=3346120 RepID=UPI003672AA9B